MSYTGNPRPVMTRDELARHQIGAHGRDHSRSDDGYDDMEVAAGQGWTTISGWGRDGWDLGDWPYVAVMVRRGHGVGGGIQMQQTCEGDHTVYSFDNTDDLYAAIDYLFLWYGIRREYDTWEALGISSRWDTETNTYPAAEALDAGTLKVPPALRGPFSWERCNREKEATV